MVIILFITFKKLRQDYTDRLTTLTTSYLMNNKNCYHLDLMRIEFVSNFFFRWTFLFKFFAKTFVSFIFVFPTATFNIYCTKFFYQTLCLLSNFFANARFTQNIIQSFKLLIIS